MRTSWHRGEEQGGFVGFRAGGAVGFRAGGAVGFRAGGAVLSVSLSVSHYHCVFALLFCSCGLTDVVQWFPPRVRLLHSDRSWRWR